jgi:hypothetical protein
MMTGVDEIIQAINFVCDIIRRLAKKKDYLILHTYTLGYIFIRIGKWLFLKILPL